MTKRTTDHSKLPRGKFQGCGSYILDGDRMVRVYYNSDGSIDEYLTFDRLID